MPKTPQSKLVLKDVWWIIRKTGRFNQIDFMSSHTTENLAISALKGENKMVNENHPTRFAILKLQTLA